jgi:hypothetical protein
MPSGTRYREYAEECLRSAQGAAPVQRAHLLRVARTWFEIADQTDAWDSDDAGRAHQTTNRQSLTSDQVQKKV